MTNSAEHPRSSPATLERRHHPRKKIPEVSYIDLLDGRNGGLILDISESGLLLQTALKVTDEEVPRLRFRLPASDRWIEARARIVWVGESGKEAGIQFLELSEDDRARIREWVANADLPGFPAAIPGEQTISQQTTRQPRTRATVPAPGVAAPGSAPLGPVRQNPAGFFPSFAQPGRATKLSWRGLGTIVVAVSIVAVLLGLRYSPRLPRLPMLDDGSNQARNAPAKTVQSPSANAVAPTAASPSQAQSPGGTKSTFGGMVTQTLSPGSAATEPNAAGIRSQPQPRTQRRAPSGPHSSDVPLDAPAEAPKPSHNTILVGAPPVGAPPARVLLEKEPVSASSFVAVTANRAILVPGSHNPAEKLLLGSLLSHVAPVYPVDARERAIEGTVRVRAFIGPTGEVRSVRLLSGPADLAPAAMSAIRKWRYAPTLLNGQAIETQADISVFFRLH